MDLRTTPWLRSIKPRDRRALNFAFLILLTAAASFILGIMIASRPRTLHSSNSKGTVASLHLPGRQHRSPGRGGDGEDGAPEREAVTAFVGIFTAEVPGKMYDQRRQNIRDTWMPQGFLPGFVFAFVTGEHEDANAQLKLEREEEEFEDIVFLPLKECYTCLPEKTLAYFEMVAQQYDARWVVKLDDDVYMKPHSLELAMRQWDRMGAEYIGCMKNGQVHTNPQIKWYEPQGLLVGTDYHLHAFGSVYVLAGHVIDDVILPNKQYLRRLANEDTTVGLWMAAFQVRHFEDLRLCQIFCHAAGISFLNNTCSGLCHPLEEMLKLHHDAACQVVATDPLPYLPGYRGHEQFHAMRVL